MESVEDTTQAARSSREDANLRISRRDVLLTGAAGAGLLATTGVSSAAPDEASSEAESTGLTITVTGLEIDGPLEDCIVEYGDERKRTDGSGNVAFDVGTDPYELTLEKEGWQSKVETIGGTRRIRRYTFPCTSPRRSTRSAPL